MNGFVHFTYSRTFLLVFICLTSVLHLNAQNESIRVFEQIQVNYQYFGFAKMAAAPDGGWAVAECDSASKVIRIVRFDPCGELAWSKTMTYSISFRPYRVSDMFFTNDGNLLLGSMNFGSNQSVFLLTKLDIDGQEIWSRAWGGKDFGGGVFSMGKLPGNKIFIVGWCNPTGVVSDMIGVIDENGDLLSMRRYYTSTIGYHTVAIPLINGHLLMRRGDRLYEVDPESGLVIWQNWNIAPLYNSSLPLQLDTGFLLVGQFANSVDRYSAMPVFLDDQGNFLSRGEMFRANGGGLTNVENLQIRRVESLPDGNFVTVTTDSLDLGYLSVVIFDRQGDLAQQIYVNPDPDQTRLLNHDFCLLADGSLAIAANANGKLAMIKVRLDESTLCGAKQVYQPVPYSTTVSSQSLSIQPVDYNPTEVPISVVVEKTDFDLLDVCENVDTLIDLETILQGCPGDSLLADATYPGATSWLWDDGSQGALNTVAFNEVKRVQVYAGCESFTHTFTVEAKEDCPCPIDFPNLFTPNGDGTNDRFEPVSKCAFSNMFIQVYSRWGQMIYSTRDPKEGWDGKYRGTELPMDTYLFVASWQSEFGTVSHVRGEVTLVR